MNIFASELSLDSMMLAAGRTNGMLLLEELPNYSLITMGTWLFGCFFLEFALQWLRRVL
jgi:hypothetical protein